MCSSAFEKLQVSLIHFFLFISFFKNSLQMLANISCNMTKRTYLNKEDNQKYTVEDFF